MSDLATRVQNLPTELFDDIFDLVFAVEGGTVTLNDQHKPPVQLQVSRATRERFAADYYRNTTFSLGCRDSPLFATWANSLPEKHRLSIRKIHAIRNSTWDAHYGLFSNAADEQCFLLGLAFTPFKVYGQYGKNGLHGDTVVTADDMVEGEDRSMRKEIVSFTWGEN